MSMLQRLHSSRAANRTILRRGKGRHSRHPPVRRHSPCFRNITRFNRNDLVAPCRPLPRRRPIDTSHQLQPPCLGHTPPIGMHRRSTTLPRWDIEEEVEEGLLQGEEEEEEEGAPRTMAVSTRKHLPPFWKFPKKFTPSGRRLSKCSSRSRKLGYVHCVCFSLSHFEGCWHGVPCRARARAVHR